MDGLDESANANAFNMNALRDEGKAELLDILESLRGRKCLVIDPQIGVLINQIVPEGSKVLKENGVQHIRDLKGDLGDFIAEAGREIPDNIIYLVRPNLAMMKVISKQVNTCIRAGASNSIWIGIIFLLTLFILFYFIFQVLEVNITSTSSPTELSPVNKYWKTSEFWITLRLESSIWVLSLLIPT